MQEQFVTHEIALMLKELGFNEPCFKDFGYDYNEDGVPFLSCNLPLWQQAIDFVFKKLDFHYPYLRIEIFSDGSGMWYQSKDDRNYKLELCFDNLEQAILKAIEIIKNK